MTTKLGKNRRQDRAKIAVVMDEKDAKMIQLYATLTDSDMSTVIMHIIKDKLDDMREYVKAAVMDDI